jgi:hypothetical protein
MGDARGILRQREKNLQLATVQQQEYNHAEFNRYYPTTVPQNPLEAKMWACPNQNER